MQLERLRDIFGGKAEVEKAYAWNLWLARVWAEKMGGEALPGLSLGDRRPPGPPPRPLNPYMAEHVEFLENFGGVVEAEAKGVADRNLIELLYASWQLQGWRLAVLTFLVEGLDKRLVLLEPLPGDGVFAYHLTEEGFGYVGYGPDVELASKVALGGRWHKALSACEIREEVDVLLLIDKAMWFPDVAREVRCLVRLLKPGGLALVAEPDPRKAPAYVAALRLIGAVHVIQKEHLQTYLTSAGLVQMGKEVEVAPYTISIWKKPQRVNLSPSDRWME